MPPKKKSEKVRITTARLEPSETELPLSIYDARKLLMRRIMNTRRAVLVNLFRVGDFAIAKNDEGTKSKSSIKHFRLVEFARDPVNFRTAWPDLKFSDGDLQCPIHALNGLVSRSKGLYGKHLRESRKSLGVRAPDREVERDALELMLPSVVSLKDRGDGRDLSNELEEWGRSNGLADEWCLDFALRALIAFKTSHLGGQGFTESYLLREEIPDRDYRLLLWHLDDWSGKSWGDACGSFDESKFGETLSVAPRLPEPAPFEFQWKEIEKDRLGFKLVRHYLPFNSWEEFEIDVLTSFWTGFHTRFGDFVGVMAEQTEHIESQLKRLRLSLAKYRSRCDALFEASSMRPRVRFLNDQHLDWLISFQIDGVSYGNIARTFNVDRKSVTEAVKALAAILRLSLRKDSVRGRPQGSKDLTPGQRRINGRGSI